LLGLKLFVISREEVSGRLAKLAIGPPSWGAAAAKVGMTPARDCDAMPTGSWRIQQARSSGQIESRGWGTVRTQISGDSSSAYCSAAVIK